MVRGTRKSTLNRRRKGALAFLIPWVRRFGIITGVSIVMLWAGAWFFMSSAHERTAEWARQKTLTMTADLGFTVQDILVQGRTYSNVETLKALINVQKGDPIFSFNPGEAKILIEKISWIRSAHVERRLPGTIYIQIEERSPLALWQKDKKLHLLDRQGDVILSGGMERFKDLVIVIGEDAPQNAPELFMNLEAEPLVYSRVKAARFMGGRRWDLNLDNGLSVKLPEKDMGLALRRLALAQEEDNLLDKDLKVIDLRESDRMIIRTSPGTVREYKASLKSGNDI